MAHKNKPDPKFIKKIRQHYDVTPDPEFMPTLKSDLMERITAQERTEPKHKPRRFAMSLVGTFVALVIVFFATPVYEVLGQFFLDLFPKTETNISPNHSYQTRVAETAMAEQYATTTPTANDITSPPTDTPVEPTRTPDPLDVKMTIEEVEQVAGFDVLVPAIMSRANEQYGATIDPEINRVVAMAEWHLALVPADSPEAKEFLGASYDPETNIVNLSYTGGLYIRQEPITGMDDCDLCTEVGATAISFDVQIGDIPGEFVIGVWNLDGERKFWYNETWVKRLRWESDNTVFQIGFFGIPDLRTMDILVAIAESME